MSDRAPLGATPERRPPTAAEARALGHPLRLRILFACREGARTNKELAESLGTTPGTIHYHLRSLLAQGFLDAEEPRPGPRGSTEQPYRATGKSWLLDMSAGRHASNASLRQVGAEELLAAPDQDVLALSRLGLTLGEDDRAELVRRLGELADEFAARSAGTAGPPGMPVPDDAESVTMLLALHRVQGGEGNA